MAEDKKQKQEQYKQDGLQKKIRNLEWQIKAKLGPDLLKLIIDFGFREANAQAKVYGVDKIEDELERKVVFARLCRFKTEYTLLEVVEHIEYLHSRGYNTEQIKDYFTPDRIAEVVCFE
jgi:hypothetical protein